MRKIDGEARTIRELLSGARYSIDYYQREYRWQTKQVVELMDDLIGRFQEEYEPSHPREAVEGYGHYFLGSIIISHKNSQNYIIDGQQRLTTLTLLLIHLHNLQKDRDDADLDALKDAPFRIGEGASLTINKVFWTLWLSNPNSFFSSGHKNYKTGADTALTVDGLTLARNTFSKQRRPGGKDPLGVRPKMLLVPASLEILADLLMTSTTLNEAASTPKSNKNPHANKFEVVASDYLDNEDYTGSSDKAWYLLAEPGAIPAVEVVFLNGKQVPTVEKNDMVFNRLGIEFRGYLDFGVKEQDPCATRLENVPFAWWRGEVQVAGPL